MIYTRLCGIYGLVVANKGNHELLYYSTFLHGELVLLHAGVYTQVCDMCATSVYIRVYYASTHYAHTTRAHDHMHPAHTHNAGAHNMHTPTRMYTHYTYAHYAREHDELSTNHEFLANGAI